MANQLPQWLIDLQTPLPNESPGDHIARCVKAFDGVSLINQKDKLNALFLVNEPTPEKAAQTALATTNCGTSARSFYALVSAPNSYFTRPYETGMAITWLLQGGSASGAAVDCSSHPDAWKAIQPGDLMRYETPGSNNDHVEWALSSPDPNTGIADHSGGGRDHNRIGPSETSDIRHSLGRPLRTIIKCDKLGIPAGSPLPVPDPTPAPTPDPGPTPDPAPQPSPNPIQPVQPTTSFLDTIIQFAIKFVGWFLNLRK